MRKKMYLGSVCSLFFLVFLFIGAGIGFAQGGPPAWMSADEENMPKEFIKAEDADGDGKVTKDEFKGPDNLFDEWDKNQDGVIELSEAPTPDMMQGMGGPGGAPPEGGMPEGGFVSNSPHVGDGPTGQAFIDVLDTDGDGKVDHMEWETNKRNTVYKNKRWPHYNKNMDDYITLDEAPQKGVNWEAAPEEEEE